MRKIIQTPPREPTAPAPAVPWLGYAFAAIALAMMFYVGMMLLPSVGG